MPEENRPQPLSHLGPRSPGVERPSQWPYVTPMFVFLALATAGGTWPALYAYAYVARAVVVAGLLIYFWPRYTKVRWNFWWLGLVVGVVGVVQWVGMQEILFRFVPGMFQRDADAFDPTKAIGVPAWRYTFIAIRVASAALVVPVMEELFWRDFAWRTAIAPADFTLAKIGEFDWVAFLGVAVVFSFVHPAWWPTAIVWALIIGLLLIYTKSIGACMIAHGVTNLLLGIYVLHTKQWWYW